MWYAYDWREMMMNRPWSSLEAGIIAGGRLFQEVWPCRFTTGALLMQGYFIISTKTGQWPLANALNTGGLPPEYFALVEQNIRGPIPDVLTLQISSGAETSSNS